jgi:hypothetical protein
VVTRFAEQLASWYLRLNGCLLTPNYIFHALDGTQRAEVDLLAVRFPHRAEMRDMGYILRDDLVFSNKPPLVDVILGEAKGTKPCSINTTLLDAAKHNMEYALDAFGVFPQERQPDVANELRSKGAFSDDQYRVRLFAFGDTPNRTLARSLPEAVQRTWADVLVFIHQRFTSRSSVANYHGQWDEVGQRLWQQAQSGRDKFFETARIELGRGEEPKET